MFLARIAMAVALLAACGATAQEPKKQPAKDPPKEKEPARLDLKSLGTMLTDLGAEPKLADNAFQKVRWTTPKWASPVWVSVSGDKKSVWLYTEFMLRPDFEKAPADAWRKILEQNDAIGPSHFSLDERGRRLALRRPIVNANVTAAQLRKELNEFVGTIESTQDLWRSTSFLPVMSSEAEKLVEQLAGKWKLMSSTNKGVPIPPEIAAKFAFEFDKKQLRALQDGNEALKATVYIEVLPGKTTFDFIGNEATDIGILMLEGDTLTLCTASGTTVRPTTFISTEKSNTLLMILKRAKP